MLPVPCPVASTLFLTRFDLQRRRKDEPDDKFLKRLSHVNLSDKKLELIENLEGCVGLTCLYLYENRISQIENLNFGVNITHLYLQDNNIRCPPLSLSPL